jgi:hypothetical protein
MRWFVPVLILTLFVLSVPAYPQLVPGGPSGDFRVNDRPGTAPTVGPPGGPSLPPDATMFRDTFGGRSPDEILKSIDKDLGRSTLERSPTTVQPLDPGRELRSPSDKLK